MKTREEMSAEIQAGLSELLKPMVGEDWRERRAEMLRVAGEYIDGLRNRADVPGDIKVDSCTVDATGIVTVRVSVRGDMAPVFVDAGWRLL